MRKVLLAAVVATAATASCTTYQQIRTMPPAEAREVQGIRSVMAPCVLDEMRMRLQGIDFTQSDRPDLDQTSISTRYLTILGSPGPRYESDVTMRQVAPTVVAVEWRVHRSLSGTPLIPLGGWEIIERCAAASLATDRTRQRGS